MTSQDEPRGAGTGSQHEDGLRLAVTIPNALTVLRMILVCAFGLLWWRGERGAALAVFAVAAVTDWLDGFLARVLDQRSRLGQLLDPAADKLLVVVCFLVTAARGTLPRWLPALVIGRDALIVLGSLVALAPRGRLTDDRIRPTRIGKYATFSQVATVALALISEVTGWAWARAYLPTWGMACAAFTSVSAVQYAVLGAEALLSGKLPARASTPRGSA